MSAAGSLRLVVGTRGSKLARAQTEMMCAEIRRRSPQVELVIREVKTTGDRDQHTPLVGFPGTGVFVKEIEQLLLAGQIDLAVHSMKDVPTVMDDRLTIVAVPPREDARDAMISRERLKLAQLRPGAVVGTSSSRRRAQLLRVRRDIRMEELRGNLDTRLRKLDEGQYDAIVLAVAGLSRLGWRERVTEIFDAEFMIPAPGQGALAIQARRDDSRVVAAGGALNDPATAAAVRAERAFLGRLGGGCHVPIGAHAEVKAGEIQLAGHVSDPLGEKCFRGRLSGGMADAEAVGTRLAEDLLSQGASAVL